LDEPTDGVTYFSLGSLISGGTLAEDKFQALTAVFSELPQRIVWESEGNVSVADVGTLPCLPQLEILSKFFYFSVLARCTCFFDTSASTLDCTRSQDLAVLSFNFTTISDLERFYAEVVFVEMTVFFWKRKHLV
jgi:hypothetical protein